MVMCLERNEVSVETMVDRELLLEFFLVFSRVEYALKASGYFKRHQPVPPRWPNAEPDWDRFAVSLRASFNPNATDDLRRACEYLFDSPPNQQIILHDAVAWETPVRPHNETDIEFLLRMVRCVRNNLFHGGKYNIGVHEDVQRTERLLRSSLTILAACLDLAPAQNTAYREAHL
jgi:hypothetical protein